MRERKGIVTGSTSTSSSATTEKSSSVCSGLVFTAEAETDFLIDVGLDVGRGLDTEVDFDLDTDLRMFLETDFDLGFGVDVDVRPEGNEKRTFFFGDEDRFLELRPRLSGDLVATRRRASLRFHGYARYSSFEGSEQSQSGTNPMRIETFGYAAKPKKTT